MDKTDYPIAKIKGGKFDGKLLYIDSGDRGKIKKNTDDKFKNLTLINRIIKRKGKNLKGGEYEKLIDYLECDSDSDNENDGPFKEYKKEYREEKNRDFFLNDG